MFATIEPFLALGGIWFWLVFAALIVALTVLVELERSFGALIACGAFFAALHFFGDMNIFSYIGRHPLTSLCLLFLYFAGGIGWSIAKWKLFCDDCFEQVSELLETFLREKKISGKQVPHDAAVEWGHYQRTRLNSRMTWEEVSANTGPQFHNHKERIMLWMAWWPFSVAWTILNDPIRKLFKRAMNALRGVYESIAKNSWAKESLIAPQEGPFQQ